MDVKTTPVAPEVPKPQPVGEQKKQPLMRDYWDSYHRTSIIITVCMQLIVAVVLGLALLVAGMSLSDPGYWIIIAATLLTAGSLNIILINNLLTPHRDIVTALTHAAGETPRLPLATPNTVRYEKDGFRNILQFVYDTAAASGSGQSKEKPSSSEFSQLKAAFNQTRAGIVMLDVDGNVTYANKAAPVVVDSQNKPQLELLFEADQTLEQWLEHCKDSSVRAEKTWLRIANKTVGEENRRIFNISANYEKGTSAEVVLVFFDSTDYYQPEDDELDFIAFAAHELRGPITVIRGYLDVLDIEVADQLAADQKELIKRLIVSANRLSGYINNILNTSKYDRRHLKIHLSEESLASVYDSIKDDMELRALSQNRMLSVSLADDLPTIAADRSSLSEVISNLIDNAIKYSNEGGAVNMTAEVKDSYLAVSISDNGIGMPGNVVGNLFHKFYRSHRSRETVAGTGIGLYICKAIIESHGGNISVNSIEGQGSTFTFTVPIYAAVADKLQANDHTNAGLITDSSGWIKNHSMYKS